MDWALHDPVHGAYGAGRLRVGPAGDFATSPSLGPDFAELLLPQLLQWFQQQPAEVPLALIETGPGEGHLALQLAQAIAREAPELVGRLELVLVEPNPGMAERQRGLLADAPLRSRWQSFAELHANPRSGVVLAHEVLDALAVERVIRVNGRWCLQGVALETGADGAAALRLAAGPELEDPRRQELEALTPGPPRPDGWCTELLRRGWQLEWHQITDLTPVATSQGGRVFYVRTEAGSAYLLPQRVQAFGEFLSHFSQQTGIETRSIGRISPPWTYQLLAVLCGGLLAAEVIFVTWLAAAPRVL